VRGDWIDWGLGVVTSGLVALSMALGEVAPPPREGLSLMEARGLELRLKARDAGEALPDELRAPLGVAGSAGEEVRAAVLGTIKDAEETVGWARDARLLLAALSWAHHQDDLAGAQLDAARGIASGARREGLLSALQKLVNEPPGPDALGLVSDLEALGASQWFGHRLAARVHAATGRTAEAEQELALAVTAARNDLGPLGWVVMGSGLLVMLGFLVLVLLPLLRRPLEAAGVTGLAGIPSGFEIGATYRVFFGWTLAYLLVVGLALTVLMRAIDPAHELVALDLALQTGLSGALALGLIQRLGRKQSDARPLWAALRISPAFGKGGVGAAAIWVVGGLAGGLLVVLGAELVQATLFGLPEAPQHALDLFQKLRSPFETVAFAATAGLLAPLVEEVLFRGFLFRNLRDVMGGWLACLVSGLAFALVHLDAGRILPLAALGAWLAYLFERSGSLAVPIGVHGLWNLGQLAIVSVMVPG
jgi:membrane protease YdiL (CAAX protease family)